MDSLLVKIKDWPVIIQGALGSALFYIVIIAGQKTTAFISTRITNASKSRKVAQLKNELVRLHALASSGKDEGAFFVSMLLLRASRYLIKALLWLTLGFIFSSFLEVLGVVGFLGCFYYLFSTLEVVKPISYKDKGEIAKRIQEIQDQLQALKE